MLSGLPLSFIENRGQIPAGEVAHYAQTATGAIGFTSTGLRIGLSDSRGTNQHWSLAMDFVGASAQPQASDRLEGVVSYFKGDTADWRTDLPTHSRITYRDLWEGIDLVYRAVGQKLKYEFVVHAGADPSDIRLRWRGASDVAHLKDGSLRVQTPAGSLSDGAPVSFQGERTIQTSYEVTGATVGFHLGAYDPSRTLVIDPVLTVYAGFIGGSGNDHGHAIAVDRSGAAYVTGVSDSAAATFPETVGPFLANAGGQDAFVAKVAPEGTSLIYAGYIGGSASDVGEGIAVDASGAAYLTGETASDAATFPETVGPFLANAGGYDAFVAKVVPGGTSLAYAGYIGGSGSDFGYGIAVDRSGAAYVSGSTASDAATFPEAVGPSVAYAGGNDAFVAKVAPDGSSLAYAGYIGGAQYDLAYALAIDTSGAAYVTGRTDSAAATFPEAVGPSLANAGGTDAFVAKVAPDGSSLTYAGFIGGAGTDRGYGIAVDTSGAAYVAGQTNSLAATFPETIGPSLTNAGGTDAFVAKVAPAGSSLTYAGFIGGAGMDQGRAIAVDPLGAAYVTGDTNSEPSTFPERVGPFLTYAGGLDAFVAKVAPGGTSLAYAGYIGGTGFDSGRGIAVDASGAAHMSGVTDSTEATFPETVGPFLAHGGGYDAFVVKLGATDRCLGRTVTLLGSPRRDVLRGTTRADVILAGAGRDVVRGRGGGDRLCGGRGKDRLFGGGGKDRLHGGPGSDICDGGPKADRFRSCETQQQ